ncbi:SMC domain protein [Thermoanaerobacter mathranii subsp. mathranii str. A3]|uniref:Nuclease SbcCD subunit C n=1 Tax=Thermoanaerobacter mathranii subsp. mathranii (strain DSM 11426 / CCUG 53645 / CIP 108742 / A3) TaxID=583358 RepID=A0ABN3Z503_THEM3|nr:SMC domain-containing protein [Thermoanaerobacter mathranii]ADH61549.1 SMC domain protein [Thermoanaerobacter mathranii subsp. mathranii str. A3]
MLKYELMRFVSEFKDKENIILKIFVKHFNEIIDELSEMNRFCLSDYITSIIKDIFKGNKDISSYKNVNVELFDERIRDFETNSLLKDLKIAKVFIRGVRGFLDNRQLCIKGDYCQKSGEDAPIIVLEENSSDNSMRRCTSALIFGWNGEGKSSITESLEYVLTGNVEEANRRGKNNVNEYLLNVNSDDGIVEIELVKKISNICKNIKVRRILYKRTKREDALKVEGDQDLRSELENNLEYYETLFSKCFIERNRIEEFILSKGADKKVKYGKLLGLDELGRVVKECWKRANTQFKDEIYESQNKTKEKYLTLEQQVAKISDLRAKFERDFREEKIEGIGFTNDDIKLDNLTVIRESIKNKIIKIEDELKEIENISQLILRIEDLLKQENEFYNCADKEKKMSDKLKQLVEKALEIVDENTSKCPLCGNENLKKGELLGNLKRIKIEIQKNSEYFERKDLINKEKSKLFVDVAKILGEYKDNKELFEKDLKAKVVLQKLKNKMSKDKEILEARKKELEKIQQELMSFENEYRGLLNGFRDFNTLTAELNKQKEEMEKEDQRNQLIQKIKEDIERFEKNLDSYYIKRLNEALSNLSEKIKDYYNRLEENDKFEEVIIKDNEKEISILVKVNNSEPLDPLTILSEGQLRCFGVSILLSVAEKYNLPFLILDDIVNAVDIERRANLIDIIKEYIKVRKIQLLITTHDKLFVERILNSIGGNVSRMIKVFIFKGKCNLIETEKSSFDFIEKIRESIEKKDCRTALMYMRIVLESTLYEIAKGKKITFSEKITGYSLERILTDLSNDSKTKELEAAREYFLREVSTPDGNYKINWMIINQEHHFWSEQSINLDCKILNEMFDWIKAIKQLEGYLKNKNKLIQTINYIKNNKPNVKEKEVINGSIPNEEVTILKKLEWLDDMGAWTSNAVLFVEKFGDRL